MSLETFLNDLRNQDTEENLRQFCQSRLLHGTPHCFVDRDEDWFAFKNCIAEHFEISHTEVYIVGSGKLGFSPIKHTEFSLESDIDVAIVSPTLYEKVTDLVCDLEYSIRDTSVRITNHQNQKYIRFLKCFAIGWIRPDLAPFTTEIGDWRHDWFSFFESISYDNCHAGNYKVTAGAFRSYQRLERYSIDSFRRARVNLLTENAE